MTPRVEILPPAQREFWDKMAVRVPSHFVLYGGTAVALRHGHRQSVDFGFFTSRSLDADALYRAIPRLDRAEHLQKTPDSLTVLMPVAGQEVKLSFFGGLEFGRVREPDRIPNRPPIAASIDFSRPS